MRKAKVACYVLQREGEHVNLKSDSYEYSIGNLCRRVLKQTIDATHRENALQEAHQETFKLRKVLLKLPSHRIKERLNSTQVTITAFILPS